MASKRKTIRHRLRAILLSKTSCGARVFSNRPTPLFQAELPAICVYSKDEPISRESRPTVNMRDQQFSVEILAEANTLLDDTLDDIAEQVEGILGDNEILSDASGNEYEFVEALELKNTETGLVAMGEKIIGSHRINMVIPYTQELKRYKSLEELDDFETADVKYEVAAGNSVEEAHDRLSLGGN